MASLFLFVTLPHSVSLLLSPSLPRSLPASPLPVSLLCLLFPPSPPCSLPPSSLCVYIIQVDMETVVCEIKLDEEATPPLPELGEMIAASANAESTGKEGGVCRRKTPHSVILSFSKTYITIPSPSFLLPPPLHPPLPLPSYFPPPPLPRLQWHPVILLCGCPPDLPRLPGSSQHLVRPPVSEHGYVSECACRQPEAGSDPGQEDDYGDRTL